MMLSRFREALEDSQQAVRLDDCFMKVCLTVVCITNIPIIVVTAPIDSVAQTQKLGFPHYPEYLQH